MGGYVPSTPAERRRHQQAVVGARDPRRFVRTCAITREDESQGLLNPTPAQMEVLDAIATHPRVIVDKYRQAYVSTIAWAWLLGQVEYTPGIRGVFMADTAETAQDVWENAQGAYDAQPEWMRIPATRAGLRGMKFHHGSTLKVMTAGSRRPAIGRSIDRGVFTEFFLWENQAQVIAHVFPGFAKRPNARMIGESTPGSHGCAGHRLVMENWGIPDARFRIVFLRWWLDPTCTAPAGPGFTRDLAELRLAEKMPGITDGHLQFRRNLLGPGGEFLGDERLFDSKYPPSVYDGWYTTSTPAFPEERLRAWVDGVTYTDAVCGAAWEPPMADRRYAIFADPASYGTVGDPSAYSIFDVDEGIEVGAWAGRVDPIAFADSLAKLGRAFNHALIACESNAAACITALVKGGYDNLWFDSQNPDHPGWYKTAAARDRSHGAFVRLVQTGQLQLRSREGIQQCMAYDGSMRRADGHHFDRVQTYLIAADLLETLRTQPRHPIARTPGTMSVGDAHRYAAKRRDGL